MCRGARTFSTPAVPSHLTAGDWFVDRAKDSGSTLHQRHVRRLSTPRSSLLAASDYDNDGDLDVYVVQGQMLGAGKTLKDAVYQPVGALEDRLFRNDLTLNADGTRTLRFTDVTDAAHLDVHGYGMGVAAGDYDNDGWVDLYRTGLDRSVLLHNNGDGTFSDVTSRAGVGNRDGWSVSAAFVDYDRDGRLDLFVGNYLIYRSRPTSNARTAPGNATTVRRTVIAQPIASITSHGDGVRDVTSRALIGGARSRARRVHADFDSDAGSTSMWATMARQQL